MLNDVFVFGLPGLVPADPHFAVNSTFSLVSAASSAALVSVLCFPIFLVNCLVFFLVVLRKFCRSSIFSVSRIFILQTATSS